MGRTRDNFIVLVIVILAGWKLIDLILYGLGYLHVSMPTIELRDIPLVIAIILIICLLAIIGKMKSRFRRIPVH